MRVLLIVLLLGGCASVPTNQDTIPLGGETTGAWGWYEMCQRVQDEELCKGVK